MINHWLNNIKKKALFSAITDAFEEVAANDGNLTDVFASLTKEQTDMLLTMSIKDFTANPDEFELLIEFEAN